MEIRVHLTHGEPHLFLVKVPSEDERIIASIQPSKIFQQPMLEIQGVRTIVTINPAAIEFIEFRTSIEPVWLRGVSFEALQSESEQGRSFDPIRLIDAEEYAYLHKELTPGPPDGETAKRHNTLINDVAELRFRSSTVRYVYMRGALGPGEEKRRVTYKIFDASAMAARWEQGGFTLINLRNVDTITVTPGPHEHSPLAWSAEPVIE
jgi:hypothetical protein